MGLSYTLILPKGASHPSVVASRVCGFSEEIRTYFEGELDQMIRFGEEQGNTHLFAMGRERNDTRNVAYFESWRYTTFTSNFFGQSIHPNGTETFMLMSNAQLKALSELMDDWQIEPSVLERYDIEREEFEHFRNLLRVYAAAGAVLNSA